MITNETIKKLKLFNNRTARLKENEDFFVNISVNLNFQQSKGTRLTVKGPDSKTTKAYLLDFRPFIANDEPVSFNYICNLIEKESTDDSIKQKAREARTAWNKLLERKEVQPVGGIRLKIDSSNLLSEDNLKMWLNSDYFHLNEEGRELLQRLQLTPLGAISHFALLDLLQRLGGILFWFDKNIIMPIIDNYEKQ